MQMSQMLSGTSPEPSPSSAGGEKNPESGGQGFGALHNRILGEQGDAGKQLTKPGKLSLSEGDVLTDADGNAIGKIVKGEDGGLSLLLAEGDGEAISLDELLGLFESGGMDMLKQFLSGDSLQPESGEEAGGGLMAMLDTMDEQQRQGVLSALTAFAADMSKGNGPQAPSGSGSSGSGNNLLAMLGVGGNGSNSNGNGLPPNVNGLSPNGNGLSPNGNGSQGLMQGLLGSDGAVSLKGNDEQGALRFEGLKLAALDGAGGQESGSRNSSTELMNLLQQNPSRAGEARENTLKHYTTSVQTPVQDQGKWGEQVASKIAWMAGRSIQAADIQLNPPDMGPIDVRVQVQNEQASITVHAQNNAVRDMLELNSNRLRDMLQENGLDLAEFDVSGNAAEDGSGSESDQGQSETSAPADGGMVSQNGEQVSTGTLSVSIPDGIDTYA